MMNRALLAIMLLAVCGTFASSQTCTPVTLNKTLSDAQHDTGTGPNLIYNESYYSGSQWINLQLGTGQLTTIPHEPGLSTVRMYFASIHETGWIAVFSGFGGCTKSWVFSIINWQIVRDLTSNTIVYQTQPAGGADQQCGPNLCTSNASYWSHNPDYWSPEFTAQSGHRYQIEDHEYGTIPGIGNSVTYVNYTTIEVQ